MGKTQDISLRAENLGAVHEFSLSFEQGPGAYQLTGRSGCGKSTLLAGAANLLRGKGSLPVSVTDGERRGLLEGFGVRMTITPRGGRRAGELEVESLEGRYDLSDFISPGYKDEAANDSKRIKAIVNLTGIGADLERFRDLVPAGSDLEDAASEETLQATDFIEMSARVKRDFERKARDEETQLAAKKERQSTLMAACEGVDWDAPRDALDLAAEQEAAIQARATLLSQDAAAEEAIESAAEAGRKLTRLQAERSGPTAEIAAQSVSTAQEAQAAAQAALDTKRARVAEIKRLLAEAEKECDEALAAVQLAERELQNAARALQQARDYDAVLLELAEASRTTAVRVPEETIAAAQARCEAARLAVETGALVRDAWKKRQEAEALALEVRQAERRAAAWRDAAASVEEVLSDLVTETSPCGIKVKIEDGKPRLYYEYAGRGTIPFHELSEGEICRVAMEVAIPSIPKGGLVVVTQQAWQDLQPANRLLIGNRCREAGVYLLTALVTDDAELHAEFVGDLSV